METCVRKIHFCYGHRVMDHESKCATLHGHNGIVWVHAVPMDGLDKIGRVIDFSVLKEKVGGWIDSNWDHTMILNEQDKSTIDVVKQAPQKKAIFILPYNPTAENLAKYLLEEVCPQVLKKSGVIVNKIVFWETENCFSEAILDENSESIIKKYK